ncbi:MAG TPA: response regulator [Polyangiaceae bacterium]|jgi:PAS domain S-box-containing protein
MLISQLPPVKFLIVDDREENLLAFSEILRRDGLEIVTARSGSQALEELLVHEFALAIIDVQMPEMDGVELAELMRSSERTQSVPIVLVTAGSRERARLFRGYEAGAVDYLYKPIEPVVLLNKAETFFELFRQRQQLARQIEQLREVQELQARILDATQDQMFVLDLEGRITWVNARTRRSQPGGDPPSLVGSYWRELWTLAQRDAAVARFAAASNDSVERFSGALQADHGGGWCDVVLAPIHDADGRVARLLAMGRDITDQRRVAEERDRLTKRLEETLRFNEMFVAALGHDLRNPISAVITGAKLIARRATDPDVVRLSTTIRNGAMRMQRMTNALFDLTRARLDGGIPISPGPLDLRPLAERVFEEHQLAAPARAMSLVIQGTLDGNWDATRLEQVISNLLGNAVQHGLDSVPIVLELRGEPSAVVIEVSNGGAIPNSAMADLFNPFRGRHGGPRSDGLGLGLFIVQQIALAHGGRVDVESSEGGGTRFRLRIPRELSLTSGAPAAVQQEWHEVIR